MNLPRHIIEARLAILNDIIQRGGSIAEAADTLEMARNNVRDWMCRRGIPLPAGWQARPTKKAGPRMPDGSPFLSDKVADPSALTEEEKEAAERFGIRFERAAWLLQCEFKGTAYGLRITR